MSESYVRNVLEAALLAAGNPLPASELLRLFEDNVRPSPAQLRAALDSLAAEYEGRGIELKETASGFRIQVRRELSRRSRACGRSVPRATHGRCSKRSPSLPTASPSPARRSRRCAESRSIPTSSAP